MSNLNNKNLLIIILVLTAVLRFFRLDYPSAYVFDEVYHGFTAKEYLAGHKDAWEYGTTPPPGVAYEWTHPPFAKEIMAVSMGIFHTTDAWAYRFPGVVFGIISVYLIYYLGKILFKSESVGLISAFIYSLDGLNFVQSRTGMNDIYFLTFALASLAFFFRKNFFWSAVLFGLALASKWTAIYLLGVYIILLFRYGQWKNFAYFILIPPILYLATYIPFFIQGHTIIQFKELQQQMWWYHTGLKATHDYASSWWSWPLNLYPVWYHVDYLKDGRIANIFASGNQIIYWLGIVGITATIFQLLKQFTIKTFIQTNQKMEPLVIVLLGFFSFWLPWALSPRIMFLYHYLPSVPFLTLILGFQLNQLLEQKNQRLVFFILFLMVLGFIITFPMLSGIPMPKNYIQFFFNTNLTKNPWP